jgi:signal peptidase II
LKASLRIGLSLAALVIFADQVSKDWALDHVMTHSGMVKITDFFNLVAVYNRGISFGLFQSGETGRWVLIVLALAICTGMVVWLSRARGKLVPTALGFVIGGALGNVFDRLVGEKAVFDFLDFHLVGYHWPAFNVADSAIAVGVGLILIDGFIRKPENVNGDGIEGSKMGNDGSNQRLGPHDASGKDNLNED